MSDDWIGIITPIKDGKYMMARATIEEDRNIESLRDAAIMVSDSEGKKEDLIYPFVLLQDIEIIRKKLIEDVNKVVGFTGETDIDELIRAINKRFGVEEK